VKKPLGGDAGNSGERSSFSWKYFVSYGVPVGPSISAWTSQTMARKKVSNWILKMRSERVRKSNGMENRQQTHNE
jgi:hypothetical protein